MSCSRTQHSDAGEAGTRGPLLQEDSKFIGFQELLERLSFSYSRPELNQFCIQMCTLRKSPKQRFLLLTF